MKKLALFMMLAMQAFFATSSFASPKSHAHNNDLVEELIARNYAEEQLQISNQQYNALSSAEKARIFSLGRWLKSLFSFVAGDGWGKYKEKGHRDEGPYMMFQYDNENEYGNFEQQVIKIREKIIAKRKGILNCKFKKVFSLF